ncbi:MAG: HD domain-containing protein [Burkholderiales bacterium]|nr:HD domain-containing protein [Burkholderiales bacterium]
MRRNDHDVTDQIRTTDADAVAAEILRLYRDRYPRASSRAIETAFGDAVRMYNGAHSDFHACDTEYHDLQHVLDVTLAMARLMDGYDRGRRNGTPALPAALFTEGVIAALFHDVGYLRHKRDDDRGYGSEYTLTHVSRGARFLCGYLETQGLGAHAGQTAELLHFTGYERPIGAIRVDDPLMLQLGRMLGSADIIAQMSDRCYLEKCRDRLYPEFVLGGLARRTLSDGRVEIMFRSGEDLVRKTPGFFTNAMRRLDHELARAYDHAGTHFDGQNLYIDEMQKNVRYAAAYDAKPDDKMLRRAPPTTLRPDVKPYPEDLVIW